MLVRKQVEGQTVARLMSGMEAMRAIGWDYADWAEQSDHFEPDLLYSLAGNAFSGYQIGPVIAATLASCCATVAVQDDEPVVVENSGSESE
jgi:hypothetical protein